MLIAGLVVSHAQERSSEVSNVNILDDKNENLNLISSGTLNPESSKQNSSNQVLNSGNSVFIQQIGEKNAVNSNINSNTSRIELIQRGTNNSINQNIRAFSVNEEILQEGDNNNVTRYIDSPNTTINFELIQDGGDNFEQYGVNSKTEDLKVNQTSSSRTIIVRSFK